MRDPDYPMNPKYFPRGPNMKDLPVLRNVAGDGIHHAEDQPIYLSGSTPAEGWVVPASNNSSPQFGARQMVPNWMRNKGVVLAGSVSQAWRGAIHWLFRALTSRAKLVQGMPICETETASING